MSVKQIKQDLKSKHHKAYLLLYFLDEISNFKHRAIFAPKLLVKRASSTFKSVSIITSNLKLLEKSGIIKLINKYTDKERTNEPVVKYSVELNSKFQTKSLYKKKLSSVNNVKQTNNSK